MNHGATPESIPVDIREDGVLWMINRTIFHPRGFALAIDPEHPTQLYLMGDGTEPWHYAESMEDIENDLFAKFEAMLERQRRHAVLAKFEAMLERQRRHAVLARPGRGGETDTDGDTVVKD